MAAAHADNNILKRLKLKENKTCILSHPEKALETPLPPAKTPPNPPPNQKPKRKLTTTQAFALKMCFLRHEREVSSKQLCHHLMEPCAVFPISVFFLFLSYKGESILCTSLALSLEVKF